MKRSFNERRTYTLTSLGLQNANTEDTTVGHSRTWIHQNIAPANYRVVDECNELRILISDVPKDKVGDLLKRGCLKESKHLRFLENGVGSFPEARNVFCGNWRDAVGHGGVHRKVEVITDP